MPRSQTSLEYNVEGMDCYDCARTIERAVTALPGVTEASVSFPSGKMLVGLDPAEAQPDGIPQLLRRLGYRSTPSSEESVEDPDQGRFDRETLSTA
ncbi:MAG: cation transporter, partial [Solirubrobacterales bacterium]